MKRVFWLFFLIKCVFDFLSIVILMNIGQVITGIETVQKTIFCCCAQKSINLIILEIIGPLKMFL